MTNMDQWDEIARRLEGNRNDMKWQESCAWTAAALRLAYNAGRRDGVDAAKLIANAVPVEVHDEHAPPVGLFHIPKLPEWAR
jgi:hypothetical protein